jgi:hypothetical protein
MIMPSSTKKAQRAQKVSSKVRKLNLRSRKKVTLKDLEGLSEEDLSKLTDRQVEQLLDELAEDAERLGAMKDGRIQEADYIGRVMSEVFVAALDREPKLTFMKFCERMMKGG